jgi:fermentation-respiration switch protein FrsA (DUF1100 family)
MAERRKRLSGALIVALLFFDALACRAGPSPESAAAARHAQRASAETTFTGMRGRYAAYRVELRTSDGASSTGRLLQPARPLSNERHAAVLLQDGRELNSRAIESLPADFGDIVVLSLDYPEELPYKIELRKFFTDVDRLRRAARRISSTLSLGADYLSARDDVDSSRLAIVASSFGVPFAVIAAAGDERFVNVGLVYGAGKMDEVLAANLKIRPRVLRRVAAWLVMRPFAEFAPEQYVARISPRPIIMVNGIDDPQMPRRAVQSLYDAARQPKTLIWLRTGHLMPDDSTLIRALVDTTLARLPALHSGSHR